MGSFYAYVIGSNVGKIKLRAPLGTGTDVSDYNLGIESWFLDHKQEVLEKRLLLAASSMCANWTVPLRVSNLHSIFVYLENFGHVCKISSNIK